MCLAQGPQRSDAGEARTLIFVVSDCVQNHYAIKRMRFKWGYNYYLDFIISFSITEQKL